MESTAAKLCRELSPPKKKMETSFHFAIIKHAERKISAVSPSDIVVFCPLQTIHKSQSRVETKDYFRTSCEEKPEIASSIFSVLMAFFQVCVNVVVDLFDEID